MDYHIRLVADGSDEALIFMTIPVIDPLGLWFLITLSGCQLIYRAKILHFLVCNGPSITHPNRDGAHRSFQVQKGNCQLPSSERQRRDYLRRLEMV